jgi:hypothetical protein
MGLRSDQRWSVWVNYEAWNRYVLLAIGVFGALMYIGLLYAGFIEFKSRLSKSGKNVNRSRNRVASRRLRNPKASGR